jgi:uncharacterized protein (TIGR02677 family)
MTEESEGLPEDASTDTWSAHLPGQEWVPAYLVSRYAAQYRVIVDVLMAEQDTSLTGLSFDEVAAGVPEYLAARVPDGVTEGLLAEDNFHLESRLQSLERWQVVTRWQEPARTGEDFLRRRDRYQLTPLAARLHAFWAETDDSDEDAAGDLTLAPRVIHERLLAFATAVCEQRYIDAASEFQVVATVHQGMARSARGWQRTLAHALSGAPDTAKQELLWRTLQAYVGIWGEQVDVHSPRISELLTQLNGELTAEVWRACVRSATSDEASPVLVDAQHERWTRTWSALASWFAGAQGQARRLRGQLRDLVAPWARNMNILMDTGGAVTRRAELLQLATAIERAPDEATAWRIWDTAVGAFPARHLMLPADSPDEHTLPWAQAPGAPVTARFREQGTRAAVGRRSRTPDYSAGRAAARRARAAELAARSEAEASLRRRSGTRLADWGTLSEQELDLLLEFVSVARRGSVSNAAGDPAHSSVTDDGRWRVTLTSPGRATETTTVRCVAGDLVTLDYRFDMEPA